MLTCPWQLRQHWREEFFVQADDKMLTQLFDHSCRRDHWRSGSSLSRSPTMPVLVPPRFQVSFIFKVYRKSSGRCYAMKISRAIPVAAATLLFPILVFTQEQEKKISRSDLPPAVEKTVAEQTRGAKIRGFSEEKENGQTFYEAELMVDGHSKDILVDENGTVTEVEEQVSFESLAPAVRDGLQAEAGSGKLVNVEKLSKKGKLVAYEAKVLSNGKRSEVQVGPDGKALDHEE